MLQNILRINFKITDQFFLKTKFENEYLEEEFQEYLHNSTINKKLASNLVIFFGYLATMLYILIAFPKRIYIINCLTCFLLALVSLIISSIFKSRRVTFINNHFQIFLSSLNIISKGYILCLKFNTVENDNVEELLRIIIYDFFSTNIYLIIKLESNLFTSIFYFLFNFSLIILGYASSNKNRYYFLEGISSFFMFLLFYILRKQWDFKLRDIFSDKIKFEKYFLYTFEYLDGLNGFNINVLNNEVIFHGQKLNSLITELVKDEYLSNLEPDDIKDPIEKNKNLINNIKPKNPKLDALKNINIKIQKKNEIDNDNEMFFEKEKNKDNLTFSLLKKLTYFKNFENNYNKINDLDATDPEEFFKGKKIWSNYFNISNFFH